jgi:hypothetical protein
MKIEQVAKTNPQFKATNSADHDPPRAFVPTKPSISLARTSGDVVCGATAMIYQVKPEFDN